MTHWATPLIGKPWVYGAKGPDAFDCWGFVLYVQRMQYGINLPEVIVPDSWPAVRRLLENHEEHRHWDKVSQPMDGDIVMMARNRVPAHVGIVIEAMVVEVSSTASTHPAWFINHFQRCVLVAGAV